MYKKSSVGSTQSSEIGYVVKDHFVNETRFLQACAAKAVGRINPYGSSVWALANESGGFVEKYAYDPCPRVLQKRQRSAAGLASNRNPDEPQRNREGRRMMPDNWTWFMSKTKETFISESLFFVGKEGFEPPKASANRFTVCPIWPLWNFPFCLAGAKIRLLL